MNQPSIWEGVGITLLISSPVLLLVALYWASHYGVVDRICGPLAKALGWDK